VLVTDVLGSVKTRRDDAEKHVLRLSSSDSGPAADMRVEGRDVRFRGAGL